MKYIPYIVIGVVILAFIGYVVYSIKKKGLKQVALEWILFAEEEFKHGENEEKFAYVYSALYNFLPAYIRVFVSESVAKNFLSHSIQKVFDFVKPALDYRDKEEV